MTALQPLLIALQFLTIIPVRTATPFENRHIGQSLVYYPLVGLIIAGLLALLAWLLGNELSAQIKAVLLLTVWVVITGALHLDGLADSADAWMGGISNKAKTLAIMKDPASGPIAVTTIVLILLIKFIMLAELLSRQDWLSIVLAITLARTALPLLLLTTPYVREGGIAALMVKYQPRTAIRIMLFTVALAVVFVSGFSILLVSFALFLLLRFWMEQRLGGTTGDTAGAMVELLETSVLVTAVIL